ncbi:hypothetical protein D9756_002421 [Leucocoprinus leucothites]|uniref:Uncharacterized protein n=1 Tax=Leucocoprinus leucothites TaxID=201217 RepID=A0A8H5LLY3_9AGAR|nr:hypothetical protein D9756_002421 [Leucoagaricus leucothites]
MSSSLERSPSIDSSESSESDVERLTMMLKDHFKLIESKAKSTTITASAQRLLGSFDAAIDGLSDDKLSREGKRGVKEAVSTFVNKQNKDLATPLIRRAENGEFKELDVLLTTFSRVNSKHMIRMKVTILEPEPVQMILKRKNKRKGLKQHCDLFKRKIRPSTQNFQHFTRFEYPMYPDNVVPMSEIVAKHKIISFFRLADQAKFISEEREFCWVLLPELLLFELTATSQPSEIKATHDSPIPHERSTFLTNGGSAGSILLDEAVRKIITGKCKVHSSAALTYQEVHSISQKLVDGVIPQMLSKQHDFDREILMLEAKRPEGVFGAVDIGDDQRSGNLDVSDEEDIDDREDEERDSENDEKSEDDGKDMGEIGERSERSSEDGEPECDEEGPNERSERSESEDGITSYEDVIQDDFGEGEDEVEDGGEDVVIQPDEIEIQGVETKVQKWLGLKDYLPQVISQCIALKTGSPALRPNIIKFVLADGDNWILGLVNCSRGKNGRVMELLVLWSSVPGKHLQGLFSKPKKTN